MSQPKLSVVPAWPTSMVGNLDHTHEDARRIIHEYNGGDFSLQHFMVKTKCALGNHYHINKNEIFTILKGGGVVVTRTVDVNGKPCGEVFKTPLKVGNTIRIVSFMAHTFVLDPGTEMLSYSSAPFNENSKDLTSHTLVDPRTLTIIVE